MGKFHTTVSRRDFMKSLAVATGGLGAATALAPGFRDMDELVTGPNGEYKRPWWQRTVDKPTIDIDWTVMSRFAEGETMRGSRLKRFQEAGQSAVDAYEQAQLEGAVWKQRGLEENLPGLSLRDTALNFGGFLNFQYTGTFGRSTFLGSQKAPTPASLGVPRWEASPEENSRMIRQVLRGYGAMTVGFFEIDEATTKKLFYSYQPAYKAKLEFEDVDTAYVTTGTDAKNVIPNKCKYVITYTNQESILSRQTEGHVMGFAPHGRYMRWANTEACLQEFLRHIGYEGHGQGVDGSQVNGLGTMPGFGTIAGLGEMSRLNRMFTPEWGPVVGVWGMVTDLPLAPTKPIDAGMLRFCATCMKCYDACGNGAPNSEKDPQWVPEGRYAGLYHRQAGIKAYWDDQILCQTWKATTGNCSNGRCFGACTFTKMDEASVHDIIKNTVSVTPVFNGFFRTMDDFMGYGVAPYEGPSNTDAERMWTEPIPIYGIDSNVGK
ncbi:MAG: reductive dehalogenase [Dehalogenimonas sp.]